MVGDSSVQLKVLIFLVHNRILQFTDSLSDLRSLRKQLHTAAESFESSHDKNNRKQLVVQLSKDYVAKALVSTVDHLGSVADKLNKFLEEKTGEFSATSNTLSCIEQRLRTFKELIDSRSMSQQLLMVEATAHSKRYILPGKSCLFSSASPFDESEGVLQCRKHQSKLMNTSQSPVPSSFSFTTILPNKEGSTTYPFARDINTTNKHEQNKKGRRSISPFGFSLNQSGPKGNRSVSPSPSVSKTRCSLEPRRAISACRRRQDEDTMNRDKEIETYTSRGKQLFRALVIGSPVRKISFTKNR